MLRIALAASLTVTLFMAEAAQAALIAHYKLDEAAAGPVVNEVGADGTNFGATINQPGQIGTAYDFNRAEFDRVIISNPSVGSGAYSVSAWINPETLVGAETTWGMGVIRATTGEFVGDFFLAVSPDGRHVAAGIRYGVVKVWDTKEWKEVMHKKGSARPIPMGLKPKDMMGIPWRVAIALQADGWYLTDDRYDGAFTRVGGPF